MGFITPSTIIASALVVLLVILAMVICLSAAVHLSRTSETRKRRRMRCDSRTAVASPNNVNARQHNSPGSDARSGLLSLPSKGRHRLKNPHSQTLLCLEDIRPRKVLNTTIPNEILSSRQILPEGGAIVSLNDVVSSGPPTIIGSCKVFRSCEDVAKVAPAHCAEMHCACAEQNSGETCVLDEQERSFAFIV